MPRQSTKVAREKPHYMKRYWADRRAGDRLNAKQSLTSELIRLLKLVKNNSAVDLRSLDASIWLISTDGFCEKTTCFAKIIIVQGIPLPTARIGSVKNISLNLARTRHILFCSENPALALRQSLPGDHASQRSARAAVTLPGRPAPIA